MLDGKDPGDVKVVKEWLRKVRESYEFLEFAMPIHDGSVLQVCGGKTDRFQLYNCVEHIAHLLQLPIVYHYQKYRGQPEIEIRIIFEGHTYFELD